MRDRFSYLRGHAVEDMGLLQRHDQLLHLFVAVAVSTGARRAQLLALRWSNVDLVRGRVAFVGGWVEGPHGPVLSDTKTSRRHQVQIDSVTLTMLSARATPTLTVTFSEMMAGRVRGSRIVQRNVS